MKINKASFLNCWSGDTKVPLLFLSRGALLEVTVTWDQVEVVRSKSTVIYSATAFNCYNQLEADRWLENISSG